MDRWNEAIFIKLFKEACEKCFGHPLTAPLSETDSKLFSNKILERTGLVIGVKSIKNYSLYVLDAEHAKRENPSTATLDTFARYVLEAPYTDEISRKGNESHFPYWFEYKSAITGNPKTQAVPIKWKSILILLLIALMASIGFFILKPRDSTTITKSFSDEFNSLANDSLKERGWFLQHRDTPWWTKRNEKSEHLTLFTLRGDNWPNSRNPSGIKNLLVRKIDADCFSTEVHLTDFIPNRNWQQAGILLSEDSTFANKALRISISYNDFFGGYTNPPEILIQVVSSAENGNVSKPEEIAHQVIFNIDPDNESLVQKNLAHTALKIERKGNHFRFLYTTSSVESFAFKEAAAGDFDFNPTYLGIFAIQGFADEESIIPAHFDSFSFTGNNCSE